MVIIFTKFHEDRSKNVDFLLMANFERGPFFLTQTLCAVTLCIARVPKTDFLINAIEYHCLIYPLILSHIQRCHTLIALGRAVQNSLQCKDVSRYGRKTEYWSIKNHLRYHLHNYFNLHVTSEFKVPKFLKFSLVNFLRSWAKAF